jgi:hypothetical protein
MARFTNDGGDGTTILEPEQLPTEKMIVLTLTTDEAFALSDALQIETVVSPRAPHRLAANQVVFKKLFQAIFSSTSKS